MAARKGESPLLNTSGGFRFLPTAGPFSDGVAAEPGYQIVRVRAPHHTPLGKGFRLVEDTLRIAGRPISALCAMELRIPEPLTRAGFDEFNRGYVAQHDRWGLRVGGHLPAARTNVAPEFEPPEEPCLHAFCHTVAGQGSRKTFVISGVPEPAGTVGGMPAYWTAIVSAIDDRMAALDVSWSDVTDAQIYGTRGDHEVFAADGLLRFAELARPGLSWFFSRPPIESLNLEIDVRGLARETWM
jgi:hypothetical protein